MTKASKPLKTAQLDTMVMATGLDHIKGRRVRHLWGVVINQPRRGVSKW